MTRYRWSENGFVGPDGMPMLNQAERAAPPAMPAVRGDLPAYRSPIDGRVIDGRSDRREDLARNNCREVDPSEGPGGFNSSKFENKLRDGAAQRGGRI